MWGWLRRRRVGADTCDSHLGAKARSLEAAHRSPEGLLHPLEPSAPNPAAVYLHDAKTPARAPVPHNLGASKVGFTRALKKTGPDHAWIWPPLLSKQTLSPRRALTEVCCHCWSCPGRWPLQRPASQT